MASYCHKGPITKDLQMKKSLINFVEIGVLESALI